MNENFEFYGKTLTGAKELRPRWKRCVQYTDSDLGEALGQKYVELTFGEEGKDRTLEMVRALEKALERDIQQLDWMTPATKKRALEKLHAITNKIGYPEKWRDYSNLEIKEGDAIGNSFRSNMFEFKRQIAKIGKPVDKKEWFMTPPTVNAYYDPQNNNINFPAGILQPPFYDNKMDEAVNYGAIGAVIGHELTHGFDDEGGRFDAKGNLDNWWTEADAKAFEERTNCIAEAVLGVQRNSGSEAERQAHPRRERRRQRRTPNRVYGADGYARRQEARERSTASRRAAAVPRMGSDLVSEPDGTSPAHVCAN